MCFTWESVKWTPGKALTWILVSAGSGGKVSGLAGRWEIITHGFSLHNNLGDEHAWTLVAKSWKVAQSTPCRKRSQRARSSGSLEGAE